MTISGGAASPKTLLSLLCEHPLCHPLAKKNKIKREAPRIVMVQEWWGFAIAMINTPIVISVQEASTKVIPQIEVDLAKCDCYGLIQECTPAYIKKV